MISQTGSHVCVYIYQAHITINRLTALINIYIYIYISPELMFQCYSCKTPTDLSINIKSVLRRVDARFA